VKNSNKNIILVIGLTLVGLLLFLFIAGFRFFFVSTPSMGQTAPVGSLIISYPKDNYQQGDIVSFYRADKVYTHRIVGVTKDGKFITRGDLNQVDDSLPLSHNNIIGSTVFIGKYMGWVWRGLPMLVIGFFISFVISVYKKVKESWKWTIRIIGGAITVVITTFILNPWLRVEMLDYMPSNNGKNVEMRVVNTGIFPIRDEDGGRFYAGEVRKINLYEVDTQGRFVYIPRPALGLVGTILVLIWCLLPTLLAMTVKLPLDDEEFLYKSEARNLESEKRKNMILFTLVLFISVVMLILQISSLAAFATVVKNSTNTSRSNDFFKCQDYASLKTPLSLNPYLSYGFDSANAIRYDLSGNDRFGTNFGQFKGDNANLDGCVRDLGGRATIFSANNKTCVINDGTTVRPGWSGDVQNPNPVPIASPNNFTLSLWFKTDNKNSNGKMIGFGSRFTNSDTIAETNDRNIYLDKYGRIVFGIYPGTVQYIASPAGVNYADNKWHYVAVSFSSTSGAVLYIDGVKSAESTTMKTADNFNGYWKIGCGQLTSWRNGDGTVFQGGRYFTGRMRFVAVYHSALTEQQIKAQYFSGK
jgi:signal peptidase I